MVSKRSACPTPDGEDAWRSLIELF
jgi:hypothetical protein